MLFVGDAVLQVSVSALSCVGDLNFHRSVLTLERLHLLSLQVNGINVENATHEEVVSVLHL